MPNSRYYSEIFRTLSSVRLRSYKKPSDRSEADALARYFYNSQLCEALYPTLQALEIALRNSLDYAISDRYGESWLSVTSYVLDSHKQSLVSEALVRLDEQGKTQVDHGDIVAALGFGFWVGLLSSEYESGTRGRVALWPHLLKATFPHIRNADRRRQPISDYFKKMRWLRNRAFHHEPILYFGDLEEQADSILRGIEWMCPDLSKTVALFSRFKEIYQAGAQPCYNRVLTILAPELPSGAVPAS